MRQNHFKILSNKINSIKLKIKLKIINNCKIIIIRLFQINLMYNKIIIKITLNCLAYDSFNHYHLRQNFLNI
jgi:hypothetical protein